MSHFGLKEIVFISMAASGCQAIDSAAITADGQSGYNSTSGSEQERMAQLIRSSAHLFTPPDGLTMELITQESILVRDVVHGTDILLPKNILPNKFPKVNNPLVKPIEDKTWRKATAEENFLGHITGYTLVEPDKLTSGGIYALASTDTGKKAILFTDNGGLTWKTIATYLDSTTTYDKPWFIRTINSFSQNHRPESHLMRGDARVQVSSHPDFARAKKATTAHGFNPAGFRKSTF